MLSDATKAMIRSPAFVIKATGRLIGAAFFLVGSYLVKASEDKAPSASTPKITSKSKKTATRKKKTKDSNSTTL